MQIKIEELKDWRKRYKLNKHFKAIENAITKNGINNSAYNNEVLRFHNFEFSTQVKKLGITNQEKTGRCWIFAALNILKVGLAKNMKVDNVELSPNYLAFYDKIEKANNFLELNIQNPNLDYNDRLFAMLMEEPVSDGGWWEWVVGLIKKYGVVPKSAMNETVASNSTDELNGVINRHLVAAVIKIKELIKNNPNDLESVREIKKIALNEVYNMCVKALGMPPSKFTLEYRDTKNKFHKVENITPQKFLEKYIDIEYQNFVNLVHDPREGREINRLYVAKYFKSVYEDKGLEEINTTLDIMKEAIIKMLQEGNAVWFDCDVSQLFDINKGIWDTDLYQYDLLFNNWDNLTKEQRLNYRLSAPTHAMVFIGVDLDKDNKPIKWEVENSWGDKYGNKGVFSMSDKWFDEYVFGAIVDPKYLPQETLDAYNKDKIELEPWDMLS